MKLKLNRKWFTTESTVGKLYIDDVFFCYTLEDVVRPVGEKVFGKTAIPWGIYNVTITYSQHFDTELPLLIAVPNFVGVRMHSGNTAKDTEGCILVGMNYNPAKPDFIMDSKVALLHLMGKMQGKEGVTIEIAAEATN